MARHVAPRTDGGPGPRGPRAIDARLSGLIAAVLIGLSVSGALVLKGTEAAFSSSAQNGANSWASGAVTLSDNDSDVALFSATDLAPGAGDTRCITLSYTGTIASAVRMYATAPTGGALASDLDLVISTATPSNGNADPTCAGTYGAWTQVWSGTLAAFNAFTTYAAPVPLAPAWSPASAALRTYKIQYTLNAGSTQQSASTQTTFTWEARNT